MELVNIKMKTTDAGPKGTKHSGKVYSVTHEEAEELVKGSFAEYENTSVKNPVPFIPTIEKAVVKPDETAKESTKPVEAAKDAAKPSEAANKGSVKAEPEKAAVKDSNSPWGKA